MIRKLLLLGLTGSGIAAYNGVDLPGLDHPAIQQTAKAIGFEQPLQEEEVPAFFENTPIETKVSTMPSGCIDTDNKQINPLSSKCR